MENEVIFETLLNDAKLFFDSVLVKFQNDIQLLKDLKHLNSAEFDNRLALIYEKSCSLILGYHTATLRCWGVLELPISYFEILSGYVDTALYGLDEIKKMNIQSVRK